MNLSEVEHPAKFTPAILGEMRILLHTYLPSPPTEFERAAVLDPFGGVGGIHDLGPEFVTWAVEIEPEWAAVSAERGHTWCGDFFDYESPFVPNAVATSCTYANRMADCHEARDASKRLTYRHVLGRMPTEGSSAVMQWGPAYRSFHHRAWEKVYGLLLTDGLFLLNVKDHVRGGQVQHVSDWHAETCLSIGFVLLDRVKVPVRGMGFGANQKLKIPYENVYVFRRP